MRCSLVTGVEEVVGPVYQIFIMVVVELCVRKWMISSLTNKFIMRRSLDYFFFNWMWLLYSFKISSALFFFEVRLRLVFFLDDPQMTQDIYICTVYNKSLVVNCGFLIINCSYYQL